MAKVRPYLHEEGWRGKGFVHHCPACNTLHPYFIEPPFEGGPKWTYNGNADKPSFFPSMKISFVNPDKSGVNVFCCHYFVTDGKIIYCGDCTHSMKGQTVELPDIT